MKLLEDRIIERINKEGSITFEAFMDMALYYPGLGYYTSRRTPVGREGDFYTSSHLHSAFGAILAKQLIEMWEIMDRPSEFHAIEIGAGAGHLCRDILDYLKGNDSAINLKYVIVEPNSSMKQSQENLLGSLGDGVCWVNSLAELDTVRGCILSNELLDAFPVHIVHMKEKLRSAFKGYCSLINNPTYQALQRASRSADAC